MRARGRGAGLLCVVVACGVPQACVQDRQTASSDSRATALARENDTLRRQLATAEELARARDAYIESVTGTLNTVEVKLAEIRGRQRGIEMVDGFTPSVEFETKRDRALSDLEALDAELTALRRELREKAPTQTTTGRSLGDLIATYERRIAEQQTALQKQKAEIEALQARLVTATAAAEEAQRGAESMQLEIQRARRRAVTIRYLIASEDDLAHAGVLRKRGVLGLGGKQLSLADLDPSSLASSCLLEANEFALPADSREPRLWTPHPPGSFNWRRDGSRLTLVVESPDAFVLLSPLLVASYKR